MAVKEKFQKSNSSILDFVGCKFWDKAASGTPFWVPVSNLVQIHAIVAECWRRSIWKNHDVTIRRHPFMWRHREHAQSIAHRQVPIGCPLKPSRYLASFPRYLAPKLRERLLFDDVMSDVISSGATVREDTWAHHIVEHCVKISSNSVKHY